MEEKFDEMVMSSARVEDLKEDIRAVEHYQINLDDHEKDYNEALEKFQEEMGDVCELCGNEL